MENTLLAEIITPNDLGFKPEDMNGQYFDRLNKKLDDNLQEIKEFLNQNRGVDVLESISQKLIIKIGELNTIKNALENKFGFANYFLLNKSDHVFGYEEEHVLDIRRNNFYNTRLMSDYIFSSSTSTRNRTFENSCRVIGDNMKTITPKLQEMTTLLRETLRKVEIADSIEGKTSAIFSSFENKDSRYALNIGTYSTYTVLSSEINSLDDTFAKSMNWQKIHDEFTVLEKFWNETDFTQKPHRKNFIESNQENYLSLKDKSPENNIIRLVADQRRAISKLRTSIDAKIATLGIAIDERQTEEFLKEHYNSGRPQTAGLSLNNEASARPNAEEAGSQTRVQKVLNFVSFGKLYSSMNK